MNINIALNTIIYLMVFLFPGVLFRRTFFSGQFKKQFEAGNTLERIFWSIIFSLITIGSFYFITKVTFNLNLRVEGDSLIRAFKGLYSETFPEEFEKTDFIKSCALLLIYLYVWSICLGYLAHFIIITFGFQKRFHLLRFQNHWEYITISNNKNNSNYSIGDYFTTIVDIKTKDGNLFRGDLFEIIYDKENKIDAIAIQKAYKFHTIKPIENESENERQKREAKIENLRNISKDNPNILINIDKEDRFIYRKRIKGEIFVINNSEIDNISVTFIRVSNLRERYENFLQSLMLTILIGIVVFSILNGIWDLNAYDFGNNYRRITFSITLPITSLFLMATIITYVDYKKAKKKSLNEYRKLKKDTLNGLIITFLCTIPYLYIFNFLAFHYTIILLIGCFIIISTFVSTEEKTEEKTGEN